MVSGFLHSQQFSDDATGTPLDTNETVTAIVSLCSLKRKCLHTREINFLDSFSNALSWCGTIQR